LQRKWREATTIPRSGHLTLAAVSRHFAAAKYLLTSIFTYAEKL
jgi:hypothetical protein